MYQSTVRSTNANPGKTALALVAILSLLLSLFAIARPAIASHTEDSLVNADQECQAEGFDYGFKLDAEPAEGTHTYTTADGTTFSVTLTRTGRSVSFANATIPVDGILVKGGSEASGGGTTVVRYDPPVTAGGPVTPPGTQAAISHVTFCFYIPPSITVEKTGDALSKVTDDVTFTVTVTNTGTQPAYLQSLTDSLQGDLTDGANVDSTTCGAVLAAGASCTVTYTYTVDAADVNASDQIVNEVTAVYRSRENLTGGTATVSDTHTVELFQPSLTVEKVASAATVEVGDPIDYTITITDTSSADAPPLVIDEILDQVGDSTPTDRTAECDETLETPCVIEYSVTPTTAGELCNTVSVETNPQGFPNEVDGTDTVCVTVTEEVFGWIEIIKESGEEEPSESFAFSATWENGEFNLMDGESELSDGLVPGDSYTVTEVLTDAQIAAGWSLEGIDCGDAEVLVDGNSVTITVVANTTIICTFTNDLEEVEETLGSITVNKEIGCELCETFTPGYFFNRGENNDGTAFTNEYLPANQVEIAGETFGDLEFAGETYESAVQEINAYLTADRSGELDGENGLSAQGQLVRQSLALYLNVALSMGSECDLGSLVYTGDVVLPAWVDADESGDVTVDELLAAALTATDEDEIRAIAEAIDQVNNSGDGDNPVVLGCPDGAEGTAGAGFSFELFGPDDATLPADSGTTDETGTLLLDGDPDGTGLPLGEYLLVEGDNEAGLDCSIVAVEGVPEDAVRLNADGTVTIWLTEEAADVTITVVNECEQPGEEDEFGEIEIVKEANDSDEPFGFSATWENGEFTLMDGESEFSGDLLAGESFTVTEVLTADQIAAGWSLLDIDCGEADVDIDGASVTITVVANTTITCTFTNELEEDVEEGELEIIKIFCPTVGTDAIFVFGPLSEEPISLQQVDEEDELPSDEGCELGAPSEGALGATFTITGGDLSEPWVVMTEWDEILTLELAPGDYTIVEEGTGLTADFTVLADGDTAVVVFNYGEEAEENEGRLKILKFYCVGEGDPVFTAVDGDAGIADVTLPANCESPEPGDADFTLTMGELTSGVFDLGDDGARLIPLTAGTYVLNEVDPNEASSAPFAVTANGTTTVIVFNFEEEGEAPNEGEQPNTGRPATPRTGEGTLGGNPLPNTAISPSPNGSVPAALLALLMLSGLGAAAYAVKAEVRRRR